MEYSKENIMTRKEYLKSKKKNDFNFKIPKYILLLVVIVLLFIYVFKQLNVYNNVTKIANKVVEEAALTKTMVMYFVAEPYSKDDKKHVMLYKSMDESRTSIVGSENFKNIQISNESLFGLVEDELYRIDLESLQKEAVIKEKVRTYVAKGNLIYYYLYDDKNNKNTGIYTYDINSKRTEHLVNIKLYQLLVDDNYIFVVTNGKTSKSIVRYNLNGSGRTQLTEKQIAPYIIQDQNNIYFINASDEGKIYSVTKKGNNLKKITDNSVQSEGDLKNQYSADMVMCVSENNLYFIHGNKDNTLLTTNLKTGKTHVIVKKNIESIQIDKNIIYYKLKNNLKIFKFAIESGKTEQVTSARTSEYICIN